MVALRVYLEKEETKEIFNMEKDIHSMLDKVMEDRDSVKSLDFGEEEIDDESLKISRYSTRHQTSEFSNKNKFNRPNKRNLTEIMNTREPPPLVNTKFNSSNTNLPFINTSSFSFLNTLKNTNMNNTNLNNIFNSDFFVNNPDNNNNYTANNNFNSKSNSNLYNTPHNDKNNKINFFPNSLQYSQPILFKNNNEQINIFPNNNLPFNFNNFNSLPNNNNLSGNNIGIINPNFNDLFSLNTDNPDYKTENRNENKMKTLKMKPANETLINELKSALEKRGKIDQYIYNIIRGNFLSIIKSHKGSILFQKSLKIQPSEEIIHLLYKELSQNLFEFITNGYSNYFFKKFYTLLGRKDRVDCLQKLEKYIVKFSCHSIGTYPIQTIIENLNTPFEKMIIIMAIQGHVEEMIYDPFGCHVLEKLLCYVDEEDISFLYSFISNNFIKLAINSNGIYIVKKILSFPIKKELHDKIKNIVLNNYMRLIKHPYGNFVIQTIVECWHDYKDIIKLYKNYFLNLSLEKYSSNVIERFIEKEEGILIEYIDDLSRSKRICQIMESIYGNYVIQKAIKLSKGKTKNNLIFLVSKAIINLNSPKLISKWKSIVLPHINTLNKEQIGILKNLNYFD